MRTTSVDDRILGNGGGPKTTRYQTDSACIQSYQSPKEAWSDDHRRATTAEHQCCSSARESKMPKPKLRRASSPHPRKKSAGRRRQNHCRGMGNGFDGDEHHNDAAGAGTADAGSNDPGCEHGRSLQPCWHIHARSRPPPDKAG